MTLTFFLTQSGKILEIQGTAEKSAFTKEQVVTIMNAAEEALKGTFDLQRAAAEGKEVEG